MTSRTSHFVVLRQNQIIGIGECAPLPGLSVDSTTDYPQKLAKICQELSGGISPEQILAENKSYPALIFGLETALAHLNARGSFKFFDSSFSRGETGLQINGLIWMGSPEFMWQQATEKIEAGFKCLKFKVGALDFEMELKLLQRVRSIWPDVEIRLDANGGFTPQEAPERLSRLAGLNIHSIEQPIRQGQRQQMAEICRQSPIPVALDEELIGIQDVAEMRCLLEQVKPRFIILKPTLHGGFSGCSAWISAARDYHSEWWLTSALESNIGLNAIAQFAATQNVSLPQGLGTGQLFDSNIPSPLLLRDQKLFYTDGDWNLSMILNA